MVRLRTMKICMALVVMLLSNRASSAQTAAQESVLEVQIVADDMCCKGCAQKVAAQLYAVPGVTSVEADVAKRLLTVTAKRSPKLTLERIWQAVEQGNGGPSKLITSEATYAMTRAETLQPAERLAAGRYSLVIRDMQDKDSAQTIANQLYAVRGVTSVSVDLNEHKLLVEAASGAVLSPWALATAAERAQFQPTAIGGPHGVFTIERASDTKPDTTARSVYSQFQGEL